MDTLFDFFYVILPSCIAGIITFGITRYTCLNNIPLDKLELTYNRVYYPIYRMIRNNEEMSQIIEKSEIYFKKYNKYVDRSTEMVFGNLKDNPYDKWVYSNFKDNIYSICRGLRRKLGYSEPSRFGLYTYLEPFEKCILRLSIELPITYLSFLLLLFFTNESVRIVISIVFILELCLIVIEFIIIVFSFVRKKLQRIHIKKIKE